jgi:hypothetical protein
VAAALTLAEQAAVAVQMPEQVLKVVVQLVLTEQLIEPEVPEAVAAAVVMAVLAVQVL